MNTSPVSGEKAATSRPDAAPPTATAPAIPASPVTAAQFATADRGGRRDAERREAHSGREHDRDEDARPRHPGQARHGARHREAVFIDRVTDRGSEQQGQDAPGDAGRPGSSKEGHGTLRFAHPRRGWPFSRWSNQGDRGVGTGPAVKVVDFQHGVASSIGSLPHTDHTRGRDLRPRAAATPARRTVPAEPFRHGADDRPAAWGISGLRVLPDGSLQLDDPMLDPRTPLTTAGIDGEPFVGLRAFLGAVAGRRAPIKLQLTGPVTLGIALLNLGVPASRAFAVAGSAVRARARTLVAAAQETAPMAPLVVFVDRARAHRRHAHRLPARAQPHHRPRVEHARHPRAHAVTGLHCCGMADWPVVLQAGAQILSLPLDCGAIEHAGSWAPSSRAAAASPGAPCPPTGRWAPPPERLWQQLSAEWCSLTQGGCDPVLLREQALVTPACGLAMHGEAQADLVLRLTNQVARRLGTQTQGMRLTVGASLFLVGRLRRPPRSCSGSSALADDAEARRWGWRSHPSPGGGLRRSLCRAPRPTPRPPHAGDHVRCLPSPLDGEGSLRSSARVSA